MTTAVGIMDREGWDQRTDILVVVSPERREVLWVPRDLYCPVLDHRINHAFQKGGHAGLRNALLEHDIHIDHSVCVLRSAVERAFLGYQIRVPVEEAQEFYYPLTPQQNIEEGRKLIRFDPPYELLHGERFHQWLGARMPLAGSFDAKGDLVRLKRQQILLRRMLEEKFNFAQIPHEGLHISSADALEELAMVRPDWNFYTLEGLVPVTIRKMYVLVKDSENIHSGV